MRAKPEFGEVSPDDAAQVDAVVHKMVYTPGQDIYDEHHESLRALCSRIGLDEFFDYFERNWDTCQDLWVMHRRAKLQHFKNHTNNRLESFFGKLKDSVDGSMSMAACVKTLIAFARRVHKDYTHRLARVGRSVNASYDEELANVLRFTTHIVTEQIERQYAAGLAKSDHYTFEPDPDDSGVVLVCGRSHTRRLKLIDWRCDCEFAMSMQLPCRHAIAYRKHTGVPGTLIPWVRIDERYVTVRL